MSQPFDLHRPTLEDQKEDVRNDIAELCNGDLAERMKIGRELSTLEELTAMYEFANS